MCTYSLKNTNKITKGCCINTHSSMCKYPIQKHKHEHKDLFTKCPVLHVYIPYKNMQTQTQICFSKTTHITYVNTLYNNKNIKAKALF